MSGASVNVDLATGVAQDGEGGTDTLRNIEGIRGSDFDDTLTGGFDDDFERFEGRGGNDIIDGGSGFDVVRYSRSDNPVNVNLATGVAQTARVVPIRSGISKVFGARASTIR